ncbi:pantetheine-phosphate adenylyltransferase [Candidatus Xenohaliotis californiensis]|uniref:pantetheine-phosphate adenylyltransferase n=1 Tax=Candidatus Xenohaliotis californiensis TaxID=84677 RepID=UPI0030C8AFD8
MSASVVVFPGSFDPMTMGHVLVVKRALRIFSKVVVAVAINTNKETMFSIEERLLIVHNALKNMDNMISIESFGGLLSDYMRRNKRCVVIRGVRDANDFGYELQMSVINSELNDDLETVFIPTSLNHQYISSTFVKRIAAMGGDISKFVPYGVDVKIKKAFSAKKN